VLALLIRALLRRSSSVASASGVCCASIGISRRTSFSTKDSIAWGWKSGRCSHALPRTRRSAGAGFWRAWRSRSASPLDAET